MNTETKTETGIVKAEDANLVAKPDPYVETLGVEAGALVEVPIWREHERGNNWMAKIWASPLAPGGLGREFYRKANGEYCYVIEGIEVGTPVEFGADYTTSRGKKDYYRWYGVVTRVSETQLVLRKYSSARVAIKQSKAIQEVYAVHKQKLEQEEARRILQEAQAKQEQEERERLEKEARKRATGSNPKRKSKDQLLKMRAKLLAELAEVEEGLKHWERKELIDRLVLGASL